MPILNSETVLAPRGARPLILAGIPDVELTEEACLLAIGETAAEIAAVPDRLMTPKVVAAAAKRWPEVVTYLPPAHRGEAILVAAIQASHRAFLWTSPEDMTSAVKAAALSVAASYTDEFVEHMGGYDAIGRDEVLAALPHNWELLAPFARIIEPADLIPAFDTWADSPQRSKGPFGLGWEARRLMEMMPERLRTPEFLTHVLERAPGAVERVDPEHQTEDAWFRHAASGDYSCRALSDIPVQFRSERVLVAAAKAANGKIRLRLEDLAPEQRTSAVCSAFIARDAQQMMVVPEGVEIAPAVLDKAFLRNPRMMRQAPARFLTQERVNYIVGKMPEALGDAPEGLRSKALCAQVVAERPYELGKVPVAHRTKAMCLSIIKRQPQTVGAVPEPYWDDPRFQSVVARMEADDYAQCFDRLPARFHDVAGTRRYFASAASWNDRSHWIDNHQPMIASLLTTDPDMWIETARWIADGESASRGLRNGVMSGAWFPAAMPEALSLAFVEKVAPGSRYALRLVPERLLTPGLVTAAIQANPDIALDTEAMPLAVRIRCAAAITAGIEAAKCEDLLTEVAKLSSGTKTKADLRAVATAMVDGTPLGKKLKLPERRARSDHARQLVLGVASLPYAERRAALSQLITDTLALRPAAAPARRR